MRPPLFILYLSLLLCAFLLLLSTGAHAAGYRVVVTLPKQPPSRVWCYLNADSGERQVIVEFDPAVSSRLSRAVTVPVDTWTFGCSSEAKLQIVQSSKDALSAPIDVAWRFSPLDTKSSTIDLSKQKATPQKATATAVSQEIRYDSQEAKLVQGDETIKVTASVLALPTLHEAAAALSTQEGGTLGGRSLDSTAPPLVRDTLEILAEIALERARTRGYALVSQRVTALVCDELKAEDPIPELGLDKGDALLPNTCEALRHMNLAEIAQAGPSIAIAVENDIMALALRIVKTQVSGQVLVPPKAGWPVSELVGKLELSTLLRTGQIPGSAIPSLLDYLRAHIHEWMPTASGQPDGEFRTCLVGAALLTSKLCATGSACDSVDDLNRTLSAGIRGSAIGSGAQKKNCEPLLRPRLDFAFNVARVVQDHARKIATSSNTAGVVGNALALVADLTSVIQTPDGKAELASLGRHAPFVIDSLNLLVKPLTKRHLPTTRELQLVLLRLAAHSWVGPSPTVVECSLELAFAAIAACHGRDGGCDARAISDFVTRPDEHFALGLCTGLVDGPDWPEISSFVARGIDIVAPPSGASTRDQLRNGLALVFALTHRLADGKVGPRAQKIIGHAEALSLGLADQDTRAAIVESMALVRTVLGGDAATDSRLELLRRIERFMPIVTTLTTNATSLKQAAANPDQAEALRKTRKESLESLIEAATNRNARGGEWVLSLGANVGLYTGWNAADGARLSTLGLPMGFAVQELPSAKGQAAWDTGCQFLVPDHFQISIIDLGQFIVGPEAGKDVSWNDFLLIGAQIGWIPNLLQSPSDAFVLGADVRYIPGGSRKGEFFVGAVAAYYVPFFDLN
jgi:hypothetical protein